MIAKIISIFYNKVEDTEGAHCLFVKTKDLKLAGENKTFILTMIILLMYYEWQRLGKTFNRSRRSIIVRISHS